MRRARLLAVSRHGEHRGGAILTPSPDERLRERLAQLPQAGVRALLAELERAQARARATRRAVVVAVTLEVGRDGPESVEVTVRYDERVGHFRRGA